MLVSLKPTNTLAQSGSVKLDYKARLPKYSCDHGYDRVSIDMRFDSDAFTATLVDLKDESYWPDDEMLGLPEFEEPPALNPKLQEVGLSKEQSEAVVTGLFDKLQYAFKGSGLHYDPLEAYMDTLTEETDPSSF